MRERRGLRQDEMTSAERMTTILNGQPIDRVPLCLFAREFCSKNVGKTLASFYSDPDESFWAQVWTFEQYGNDEAPRFGYGAYGGWEFGGEIEMPSEEGQAPSVKRFPVQSEEDIWKLELPDLKRAGSIPLAMRFAKLQDKYGLTIRPSVDSPFSTATNICGINNLFRWMMKKPDLAHRLLHLSCEHIIEVFQYWLDTFALEHIQPWIVIAMESLISPKQFEEFALPYLKQAYERILAMGIKNIFSHICANQNLNLPYLAQVPMGDPGIVSVGHEVDLTAAIKYFGDRCIIAGNIEPAAIQCESPQRVHELCKEAIEKGKNAPRGFMLMTGCSLPPKSPPYNVYIMRKAVSDFGWYDQSKI